MSTDKKVFILAVEPSGDQLGAYLIQELKKCTTENLSLSGIGGSKMADLGVSGSVDLTPLSVVGLIDGLRVYPKVRRLVDTTVKEIVKYNPQIVILIDSWGFTIRVAKELKKTMPNVTLVKYVAPQVFATRPGRAKTTAAFYDHLFTIHSFDGHFFEAEGLDTTFIGTPALFSKRNTSAGSGMEKYNPENKPIIGVFFGSRASEIKQQSNVMLTALEKLKVNNPDLIAIAPLSDNIATLVRSMAIDDERLQNIILLDEAAKSNVFENAKIALACSGTVTLELADAGVPTVVAYQFGGWFGVVLQKLMFKAKFASLINLAADEEIFPEFINFHCTADNLTTSLDGLLNSAEKRKTIKQKLKATVKEMRGETGNPNEIAAKKVIALLNQRLEIGE